MLCMARLNRNAAYLMHKYEAHAATDVTGFGILGHARNLARNQKAEVAFVIHTLPILANMVKVYEACGVNFKLLDGFSAETSGELFFPLLSYCIVNLALIAQILDNAILTVDHFKDFTQYQQLFCIFHVNKEFRLTVHTEIHQFIMPDSVKVHF